MTRPRIAAAGLLVLAFLVVPDFLPAPPNPIASLSLSPTSVLGGASSTGTVTLGSPAPSGGAVVALTRSNASVVTVPPNVTVPAGQTSAPFTITTSPVGASTAVTITASYAAGSRSATLTVTPAVLTSVSVSPVSVAGGTPSTGTVSFNGPAPAAGRIVSLSSSNPSAATVPGTVTVVSSSATFSITTLGVASSTNVTITAVNGGVTKTAILTVTPAPPALSAIIVNPTTVVATASVNGTATLNQPAPAGGAVVALSSSDPAVASVPASITVPAGSTSDGFGITTYSVPGDASVTISGSYGGVGKTAALSVIATFSLTLDDGSGPIYTKLNTVGVKGHVAPAIVGPRVLVRGTLGAQNVTVTPASNGAFTLPSLTLALGSNAISVTGTSGSQSVGPVPGTYVYDNVVPTASVILNTEVPNPTNVATWTLSGTVSPYQGAAENAFVYLNGGTTRFPIAGDGTWSGSYTFTEGRNWIPFVVADLAGNYKNPPDYWDKYTFYLDTLGLRPTVVLGDYVPGGSFLNTWPTILDQTFRRYLGFGADSGASLNGSHLDVYFDEQGSFPGGSPVNCAPDNLTCLVERKPTPDISVDFPTSTQFTTPLWSMGIHTIRMVLRDPFGNVYERGALLPMAQHFTGSSYTHLPLANFGVPGTVTTQSPKLVGRMVDGVAPLDCNDNPGNRLPSFSYWDPKQGGSWKPLTASSSVVSGGVYEATPTSNIPITTLASGQTVLRIKLTEGVVKTNLYGNKYLEDTFGRNICDGQTVITSVMKTVILYEYPYAGSDAGVFYDLPYRSTAQGDNPAPQIDASAMGPEIATDTSGPYSLTTRLRVTDLNGDLDYRNVTVATAGCGDSSCTYSTRLAGDQLLSSALPGGYFSVLLPLVVGANNFVATARDDAGHVTNQSFTINRNLTEVEAKITSPTATGTYAFCSPTPVTFDASQSVNRTNPPTGLRYQWTVSPTNSLISTQPTYTETLQSSGSRRVIVSSMAISAPNAQASDPCAGNSGKCSVASVTLQPFSVSTVSLPAQILTPGIGASVRMDLPVTLTGTVSQNADPSYVYKWRLQRASNLEFLAIPQSTGTGSDPSYAVGNRTLTLRLDSIPLLVAGGYTLFFHAAHLTSPGSCIEQQTYTSIGINVTTTVYTATGVSPGAVVVGDSSTRLYGSGFDTAAQIAISGPIYTLDNITTPLCTMPACPQVAVLATVGANGTTLDFTVPVTLAPGFYQVFAADPSTGAASSSVWLEVQPLQGTAPAKTQTFSNWIWPIVSGQTLNGQFLAGRDLSGQFSDVDYYYFFATAGSTLSLSLSRTDTSLPWEAPDALDPQLLVLDPDGIVWQGFESLDNQAGVDLNASLTGLVLPKTGRYTIYAATSKGFGPYQLTFSLTTVAPPSTRQVLPAKNNDRTVPLNIPLDMPRLKPMAFAFDPRGYPLAGAIAQFVATPDAGETGQIIFPSGSSIATSTRGFAQVDATLIAAGKISFEARLTDASVVVPQNALVTQARAPIPTYRPVGMVSHVEQGANPLTGEWSATFGKVERLELAPLDLPVVAFRTGKDGKKIEQHPQVGTPSHAGHSRMLKDGQSSAGSSPTSGTGPLSMDVITTCSPGQFRAAGVNASAVQGPFTVTLTDLTPKTGQPSTPPAEEVIGVAGINKHRVDKTIKIRIGIKDAAGAEPTYPVLVRLSLVGGTPSGTLILDPEGARIPCQSASFLWHERNAEGQIIALNEEFEYQLTKRSVFVGVKPDPENPGEVLPVWGTTESLNAFFGTFDAEDGTLTNQFSAYYGVHPEPGSPHHFKWNPTAPLPAHQWDYLTAYRADFRFPTYTNGQGLSNLYYLADVFDNSTYGHTATSATSPAGNVQVAFAAQQASDDPTEGPSAYRLTINWNNSPQWPNGSYVSTLTVAGTDVETGPFSVFQNFTAAFSQPEFHSLVWVDVYDPPGGNAIDTKFDFSVDPPVPITFVSPGAARTFLNGVLSRNSIVLVKGTRLSWTSVTPIGWIGPPGSDPTLVTDGLDSFDVSLVDDDGNLVTDSEIQVAFCLNYEVERDGPCPTENRTSSGGVILGVRPTDRGYMGLMVTKAPAAPGVYFFRLRPLPSNVHEWRVGGSLDPMNNYTYTYAVTVRDGEILDENFQRVPTPTVTQETQFYFRLVDSESALPISQTVSLSVLEGGASDPTPTDIVINRLGSTNTYIGPFVLYPDAADAVVGQSAGNVRPAASSSGPQKKVKAGRRRIQIRRQNQIIGDVPQNTPFELALTIDTTAAGRQPNLLLADGQDATNVRAKLVTPLGKPFYAQTSIALTVGDEQGMVLNLTEVVGPLTEYDFRYQAPALPLDLDDPAVYRPIFYATVSGSTTALSYRNGGFTTKHQWPMYYRGHNFRDMLVDSEFVFPGSLLPSELLVQAFLQSVPTKSGYVASFLKDFYFVNMSDPPPGTTNYPASPVHGFVDVNGNGTYDPAEQVYCDRGVACQPLSVTNVNRFSHVLFDMGARFGVSAANLLTTFQKETVPQAVVATAMPQGATLDQAMGCGLGLQFPPLGFVRQLVCGSDTLENRFEDAENERLDFFPAPTGEVFDDPQIVAVCADPANVHVAAAYQSVNKASRAQAKYTNTVINCADAGTYSFAYWWHYFFGGPP